MDNIVDLIEVLLIGWLVYRDVVWKLDLPPQKDVDLTPITAHIDAKLIPEVKKIDRGLCLSRELRYEDGSSLVVHFNPECPKFSSPDEEVVLKTVTHIHDSTHLVEGY